MGKQRENLPYREFCIVSLLHENLAFFAEPVSHNATSRIAWQRFSICLGEKTCTTSQDGLRRSEMLTTPMLGAVTIFGNFHEVRKLSIRVSIPKFLTPGSVFPNSDEAVP
jgi:hypothetical protein